jgi:alanine dehydrogenase
VRVGVPTEVKPHESRVAITPAGVRELGLAGHEVLLQRGAGLGSSISDEDYAAAGAELVDDAGEVWAGADLVCKVKEPVPEEFDHLRSDLVLFTFLHLAAAPDLTRALAESGCLAIGYETVKARDGSLPLLAPMSQIAGRMAPQVGAAALERERGGRGVLLGGVPGVEPGHVVVLGAGIAGRNAAWIAMGLQARVTLLDIDLARLREVDEVGHGRLTTLHSNRWTLERLLRQADLVVGAVLVPGARTPRVVTADMVASMPERSVVVDISIDQGGCLETSRMTTHDDPTYVEHGVVHYAVGNMPGAVPATATQALAIATLPYVLRLADDPRGSLQADPGLLAGVNVVAGKVTNDGVAAAHGLTAQPAEDLLASW